MPSINECVKRFKQSRFLIVRRNTAGREQDFLGAKGIYIDFDELQSLYKQVDREQANEWAQRWSQRADRVVEPQPDAICNAAAVFLATRQMLKTHSTDNVTMDCLGGFAAGKLPAYPCLGFMQILDDGGQGVCEAMPDDTLSMIMARILTGRPGFVSDPVLDTSKNHIVYAHCVATTKVFGPQRAANEYRIRTLHNHDPRGACVQSFLPAGFMTTSFRTNFRRKQMIIHQAKAVGNLDSPRGCRTQLVAEVRGDIGKLFDQWVPFGWHRVTVYGDVQEPLTEFGRALGLEVIAEA
jgi:L-fucose isomerase-like protein